MSRGFWWVLSFFATGGLVRPKHGEGPVEPRCRASGSGLSDDGVLGRVSALGGCLLLTAACTAVVPSQPDSAQFEAPLVFGRAVTVIMGDLTRIYPPEIRFLEVANKETGRRMQIQLESQDDVFVVPLPVGDYELTRVQISEGPFMSMADFAMGFQVLPNALTYVGTWRFGVESPQYGRMILLSAVRDQEDRSQAETEVKQQFPHLSSVPIETTELSPAQAETRLYEVMPYPRYPRYFRRHLW